MRATKLLLLQRLMQQLLLLTTLLTLLPMWQWSKAILIRCLPVSGTE
jgi:hypothetical protein